VTTSRQVCPNDTERRQSDCERTIAGNYWCMAGGLMNNFNPDAQWVLASARSSADKHRHNHIGPEHIADALVMRDWAVHYSAWRRLQFDIRSFHNRLLESMPQGNHIGIGNIPYTAEVKMLFALSAHAARRLGHDWVGTEHFLLAFFDFDTPVSGLFESMGLTRASVEEAVLAELELRAANRAAQLSARDAAERTSRKHGTW
jgi:ATP-dependent Clp protease ATP-binding subunit ClpA